MSDKEKPRQRRSHGDTWLPSGGIVADAIRAADVAAGSANHDDGYRLRHALTARVAYMHCRQKLTWSAPFSSSISRASSGLAISRPSPSMTWRAARTC